jgi:hypothetical protein
VRGVLVVLPQDVRYAPRCDGGVGQADVADEGGSSGGQVGGYRQPPFRQPGAGWRGQAAAVLVVPAGELDVVEDDPGIGRIELGDGGQAGKKFG